MVLIFTVNQVHIKSQELFSLSLDQRHVQVCLTLCIVANLNDVCFKKKKKEEKKGKNNVP